MTKSISSDYNIHVYNLSKAELVEVIDLKPKGIYEVKYSPDRKLLANGSADKKIRIWSV
ncbi:MAG: hypothetical protein ACFE8B_00785 [Candidatus Hermodarchaeota archaeon]